jgi:hypothetical protein
MSRKTRIVSLDRLQCTSGLRMVTCASRNLVLPSPDAACSMRASSDRARDSWRRERPLSGFYPVYLAMVGAVGFQVVT